MGWNGPRWRRGGGGRGDLSTPAGVDAASPPEFVDSRGRGDVRVPRRLATQGDLSTSAGVDAASPPEFVELRRLGDVRVRPGLAAPGLVACFRAVDPAVATRGRSRNRIGYAHDRAREFEVKTAGFIDPVAVE